MSTAFEKRLGTLAQAQYDKYRWLREAGGHHGGAVHVLCAAFAVCERGRRQCQVSHRRLHGPRRGAVRAEDARHLQSTRGHGAYTFQYAATHRSYPSHCAIVMEVGVDSKGNTCEPWAAMNLILWA